MASENKPSVGKMKSSNQDGSSKGKIDSSSVNRKKIDSSSRHSVDSKQKNSVSTVTKTEVKSKSGSSSSKTTTTKTTTKVREKKVYTLAGQRFDPPEEREPLRIFYESLSKQIPTSEMAEFCYKTGCSLRVQIHYPKSFVQLDADQSAAIEQGLTC